tara:strand:+ start:4315 stop:4671 length:357 start_codon:yes stop_codon:yes gene_type:complete
MKANELKKMIKDAVKEAIQDELKEILLEALKSPKQVINESKLGIPKTNTPPPISTTPQLSSMETRQKYMDVLDETALNYTSKDVQKFNPQGAGDTTSANGQLPGGEVGMDQIMNLMKV